MQNRKDLLQAHRLMTQRAALALLQAEPDPPDRPLRRLNVGLFSSVLVAVIVVAIFGIWGWIDPGNAQGLNTPGILIMDSTTGTSYVWCENNKRLCPVVNYASARLALNSSSITQRTVSQASLAKYPRGPEIGIPGLPQALPGSSQLTGSPWSVCVQSLSSAGVNQPHPETTLVGGHRVGGKALSSRQALLVQEAGQDWLIWNGERLPFQASTQRSALAALNTIQQPATMPLGWLNAFRQGPAFAPPNISHPGKPVNVPPIGQAVAGQVFTTSTGTGSTRQFYVMLSSGKLKKVTQTQAALLTAVAPDGAAQRSIPLEAVAADSVGSMPSVGLPASMPNVVPYAASKPLCVVYNSSATAAPPGPQVTVGGTVPSYAQGAGGSAGVNQVALPPGTGALVGVVSGAQTAGQAPQVSNYFLMLGGVRYGLASQSVAGVLGYNLSSQRTLLPAWVAQLVPVGTALDPNNAKQQVQG
jgi:type VII secretion protein EccB